MASEARSNEPKSREGARVLSTLLAASLAWASVPTAAIAEVMESGEALAQEAADAELPADDGDEASQESAFQTESLDDLSTEEQESDAQGDDLEEDAADERDESDRFPGGLLAEGMEAILPSDLSRDGISEIVPAEFPQSDLLVSQQDTSYAVVNLRYSLTYGQTEARKMLSMVNSFRTGSEAWHYNQSGKKVQDKGLKKLTYDYDLERVAMQRATEIAIFFSHTRPNGESCYSLCPNNFFAYGENIAAGHLSASEVMNGWKETNEKYEGQGHRRNMLGADYNAIGVGHVVMNGVDYWVQELGYTAHPNTSSTPANNKTTSVSTPVDSYYLQLGAPMEVKPRAIHLEKKGQTSAFPTVTLSRAVLYASDSERSFSEFKATVDPWWGTTDSSVASVAYNELTAQTDRGSCEIVLPLWNGALFVGVDIYPFRDVTSKTAHLNEVLWLYDTGISTGWSEGGYQYFKPNAEVKRGDLAAFLYRTAATWGLCKKNWKPSPDTKERFVDVNDQTSHAKEIYWLAENGITSGWATKDGEHAEFRPNQPVKRGDLAAFLARLAALAGRGSSYAGTSGAFADVNSSTAHAEEITWLAATGISTGWDKNGRVEFRPNANVKRGDMAAFLARLERIS